MKSKASLIISIIIVAALLAGALWCLFYFTGNHPEKSTSEESYAEAEAETDDPVETETPEPGLSETEAPAPEPAETETPEPEPVETETPAPEPAETETPEPEPAETETPAPEPVLYLGDLEDIPAGTYVGDKELDPENLDQYFQSYEISDAVFERIYGDNRSYKTYCTVPRSDLRYIKVLYWGYDGLPYVGELMVNYLVADDITDIFEELYKNNYQIERMLLVDEYDADDDLSIAHNNTSAFNFRPVTGGTTPSNHAYGCAIDVNPLNNPYIEYDADGNPSWYDVDVELYMNRDAPDAHERHMIDHEDLCFRLFTERGWAWGGDWANPVDYQHFEKPIYP